MPSTLLEVQTLGGAAGFSGRAGRLACKVLQETLLCQSHVVYDVRHLQLGKSYNLWRKCIHK